MTKLSEVTEDGTYMVDASGDLHRMEYSTGYMVGVAPITIFDNTFREADDGDIPPLTLVGRWTDRGEIAELDSVYWDEVELIDNLLDAGNIARERGELAIWDNLNNCEVRV